MIKYYILKYFQNINIMGECGLSNIDVYRKNFDIEYLNSRRTWVKSSFVDIPSLLKALDCSGDTIEEISEEELNKILMMHELVS